MILMVAKSCTTGFCLVEIAYINHGINQLSSGAGFFTINNRTLFSSRRAGLGSLPWSQPNLWQVQRAAELFRERVWNEGFPTETDTLHIHNHT